MRSPEGRVRNRRTKAAWTVENKAAETTGTPWRGGSDGMITRTYWATGEALLVPGRNSWKKVHFITDRREMDGRREGIGGAYISDEPQ